MDRRRQCLTDLDYSNAAHVYVYSNQCRYNYPLRRRSFCVATGSFRNGYTECRPIGVQWLVKEDDKQHSEDLPIHTRPFAVPETDKEIIEDVISAGVSKMTQKIWNQWTSYRQRKGVPSKY